MGNDHIAVLASARIFSCGPKDIMPDLILRLVTALDKKRLAKYFTRGEYNCASWIWKGLPSEVFCEMTPK
jgi:hypothetical protein